jgi:hypothetical protein
LKPGLVIQFLYVGLAAGSNYDDIMNTFGISKSGFYYYSLNKFLIAVLNCNSLDINPPTNPVLWEKICKGFASKSVNQFLKGFTWAHYMDFFN